MTSFAIGVQPERRGSRGPVPKPRLEPPSDLLYAQVVKRRRKGRVVKVTEKKDYWMERQLHLSLGYYHFCRAHSGLRDEIIPPLPTKDTGSPRKWREVSPATAVGITDHKWTLKELLTSRVLPPFKHSTIKRH